MESLLLNFTAQMDERGSNSVEINLLFFAKSRELTGVKEGILHVTKRPTPDDLLQHIVKEYPQ